MLIRIDPAASAPLAEQVSVQIRRAIALGEVALGERLPAARELAASLGINMHTVLRAYESLRAGGLIELRRGRGAVVIAGATDEVRVLHEAAARLVVTAAATGVSREELATMIRSMA